MAPTRLLYGFFEAVEGEESKGQHLGEEARG